MTDDSGKVPGILCKGNEVIVALYRGSSVSSVGNEQPAQNPSVWQWHGLIFSSRERLHHSLMQGYSEAGALFQQMNPSAARHGRKGGVDSWMLALLLSQLKYR